MTYKCIMSKDIDVYNYFIQLTKDHPIQVSFKNCKKKK